MKSYNLETAAQWFLKSYFDQQKVAEWPSDFEQVSVVVIDFYTHATHTFLVKGGVEVEGTMTGNDGNFEQKCKELEEQLAQIDTFLMGIISSFGVPVPTSGFRKVGWEPMRRALCDARNIHGAMNRFINILAREHCDDGLTKKQIVEMAKEILETQQWFNW